MIELNDLSLTIGGKVLFKNVNLTFAEGNCYGVIGANGAGKSTFLKMLAGQLEPTGGVLKIEKNKRISVLNQDHGQFDEVKVIDTVIAGHSQLTKISEQRNLLYSKTEFSDEDGLLIAELESEFAELGGYEAESDAAALLIELGIKEDQHQLLMAQLDEKEKVRVLLAQALFGNPDILLLDEPTNGLDELTSRWLEEFIQNLNLVIVVSHDRHFLNKVATRILDIDFQAINVFVGNYDFWYESSQLMERQLREQNKKAEMRMKELQDFIARFSANAAKSRQATSRRKELDKIQLNDLRPSTRRYPFIDFRYEREIGNDVLSVSELTLAPYFSNLSFTITKGQKVLLIGASDLDVAMLLAVLAGKMEPDSGSYKWGVTTSVSYIPQDNSTYFQNDLNLIDFLRQFSKEQNETYIRGWLGRMLFAKEEAFKQCKVLSGGEKVRMMLAKTMLEGSNCLLLDDPSNHLDLEAITVLNKGLINFRGCLLFTSHDREIASTVANRIIKIDQTLVFDKEISYDEFMEVTENV